jgi:hypothetical protein
MMMKNGFHLVLGLGLLLAVVLACGATTANIGSIKLSTDKAGEKEASTFKPGDAVYTTGKISNNGGTVTVKWRILYDEGDKAGTTVPGAEKTLDAQGDQPFVFWITLPPAGFKDGRYKSEVSMIYSGEQKDQKSATFEVSGY